MRANDSQHGSGRAPVAPDSRRVSRAISATKRRTAEYTPRRDVSAADAIPIRRRSAAALTPAFVTQRARVRRRGHARLDEKRKPRPPRHRLPFLNRTLFAGVPIPPLEVEIAA
jgi:hypothetical protein